MKQTFLFGVGTILLSVGLAICGFVLGKQKTADVADLFPVAPVFATASSESDGVVIATGTFSANVEAMYYLDSQSGRLSAGLISRSAPVFQKSFTRNLKNDLVEACEQIQLPIPTVPKFLMITGESDIRNVGASSNMSRSLLYVSEINTGLVFVYALPGSNDRDLVVDNGEIILWTFARLNDGLQTSAMNIQQPGGKQISEPTDPELINSGFYRTR